MRRRIVAVIAVGSAVLLGATAFVSASWAAFTGLTGLAWKLVPLLLVVGFIPATLLGFRRDHPAVRGLSLVTSSALGFLNYAVVAALAGWIVLGVATASGHPLAMRPVAFVAFGAALAVTIVGMVNAAFVRITRVTVRLAGLPEAWRDRDIALVSDLHLGNIRRRRLAARVVKKLRALDPVAVFVSGDMFDGTRIAMDPALQPWTGLRVPQGIYFVTGNHEEFHDRREALAAVRRAGLTVLQNEKIVAAGLQIVGVHDAEAAEPEVYRALLGRAGVERHRPSILLTHRPDNLPVAEQAGVSLQLSGHTHRGQFWPWSWVVGRVYGEFAYGLHSHGGLQVCTSSGAGTWGPPLRVGTRSEIVLLHLRS